MFRLRTTLTDKPAPRVPDGYRAYAVGDIHGRLDLLEVMLALIELDIEKGPSARNVLVFLGDLIDRGPDSRGVIDRLANYAHPAATVVLLAGNHEEVLLRLLNDERGLLANWLKFGGAQCLESYGLDPVQIRQIRESEALQLIREAIPPSHQQFVSGFSDTVRLGDYLFVHAGIRPGVDMSLQRQMDLRWMRQPFLDDDSDHGFVVVHGHTITREIDERRNRIGVDTGAYRSGILSAIVLEGETRRSLSAILDELGANSVDIDLTTSDA
jgi:serine/threonine protein phosphatase 1